MLEKTTQTLIAGAVLVSTLSGAGQAQVVFDPFEPVPGDPGSKVEVVDLNQDGRLDVVSAGLTSLTVALGDGEGGFSAVTTSGLMSAPFAIGDIDEDGVMDIAHGSPTSLPELYAWSRGLGDGAFAPPTSILAAASGIDVPNQLFAGDVDGDAHLDLALMSTEFLWTRMRVLRGDGLGGFSTALDFTVSLGDRMLFADFDGDGFDDLMYTTLFDGTISFARSLGNGGFAATQAVGSSVATLGVALSLPGDPRAALITSLTDQGIATIQVSRLNGASLVEIQEVIDADFYPGGNILEFAVADFDGDGRRDVAFNRTLQISLFSIDSTFGLVPLGRLSTADLVADVAAGDLNGDGRADLVYQGALDAAGLAVNHTYFDDEPFQDLGGELPSSLSLPVQIYDGDFGAGNALQLQLAKAPPSAPAFLILGLSRANLAFAGGVIVPSPDLVLGPLLTSTIGQVKLTAAGLSLPIHQLFGQWWIMDDGVTGGFSASSAVLLTPAD